MLIFVLEVERVMLIFCQRPPVRTLAGVCAPADDLEHKGECKVQWDGHRYCPPAGETCKDPASWGVAFCSCTVLKSKLAEIEKHRIRPGTVI